ncbi:MAG: dihydrodipicolinate synthase family protein [Agrococcus casei]|uniref:dihydrodipicolinate synthase family protein n=1 Tax=Agrococcus casei TaxID=343512 RepID=UPI003F97B1B9
MSRVPTGVSAFPLTPLRDDAFDRPAFERVVARLAAAEVDTISVLGSTGSYAYLSRAERREVVEAAVAAADGVPVSVGIGALRTSQVQALAEDAQEAGADGVLLAPMSYQALSDDEVFGLFDDVTRGLSVPLTVYDNPGTTHFTFTTELVARVAALPNVAAIKIPPPAPDRVEPRIREIRAVIPQNVAIGISGDSTAASALLAGCDLWHSVIGGVLPEAAIDIARAARSGDADAALAESDRLRGFWQLFAEHGSLKVTAAIAEHLGLVAADSLPKPIRGLSAPARQQVADALSLLD